MRRWAKLVALVAVWASASTVLLHVPGAQAVAPDATAWWWAFEDGLTTTPGRHPFDAGSLYVASHPEGPAGVAALRLALPDDNTVVQELVLTIDRRFSSPRDAPIPVRACPTNDAWATVEGGSLSTAPKADCSTGFTAGVVDGDNMRFAVGGLVRAGYLNIVLGPNETTTTATTPYNVPQPPSDPRFPKPPPTYPSTIPSHTETSPPTTAPFEVVFKKPTAEAIKLTTYTASEEGGGGEEEVANPFLDEGFAASIGIEPAPTSGTLLLPPPAPPAPSAPASGPSRRTAVRNLPPAANIVEEQERNPKVLMALVLTGLVLLYLGLLGGSGPLRRLPGPFGRVLPEPDGPVARGIGRFARPRERPPLRL